MASRRHRRRSWSKRLRRTLIEHRFSAAQGALGLIALSLGLSLLWPADHEIGIDHHLRWEQSLAALRAPVGEFSAGVDGRAFDGALVPPARASGSISVKRQLDASWGGPGGSSRLPRLARVDPPMPQIGESSEASAHEGDELLVQMPDDAGAPGAEDVAFPIEEGQTLAIAPEDVVPIDPVPTRRAGDEREVAALALPPPGPSQAVPAWLRYAAVPPVAHDRPMIAVVIDDLGLNRRNTAAVNQLTGPLTVAFLPYAGELERQTRVAREAGHELLLHMPMEPVGQDWPGPNALLTSLSPDEFRQRLIDNFDSFGGFVGMNNHMGSRLTADPERMAVVMEELRKRDLLFLDSMTTARSVGTREARRHGVPHARRDVFIDTIFSRESREQVEAQLAKTERTAREKGMAVAIGHPHDATIEALRDWLPTLEKRGFALVPISTIVARQACIEQIIRIACSPDGDLEPVRAASRVAPAPG